MDCQAQSVKRFCPSVNEQLGIYRGRKKGLFSRYWVMGSAESQPAYAWWDSNGTSTHDLVFLLPACCSHSPRLRRYASVSTQKSYSSKTPSATVWSMREQTKLVALFHSPRLMSKMRKSAYSTSQRWEGTIKTMQTIYNFFRFIRRNL